MMGTVSETTRSAVLVVFNPVKVNEQKLRERVYAHAPEGRRIEWVRTTAEDDGQEQAAAATRPGIELVIVAGGDGTVRTIASALAGSGVSMAIVPSGTGNLLARNLGMDLGLDASVRRAFTGNDRRVDLCHAKLGRPDGTNERMGFVVMAGFGLDTGMIEHTDERLKKRIGPLAYGQGILRSLMRGRSVKVTYTVDGDRIAETALHTLIFGNCGYLINDFPLFPSARPDDGVIDVVAMAPRGFIGWVAIFNRLAVNSARTALNSWRGVPPRPAEEKAGQRRVSIPRAVGAMEYAWGERVTVEMASPHPFELDGDPVGVVNRVDLEIEPGALLVRV